MVLGMGLVSGQIVEHRGRWGAIQGVAALVNGAAIEGSAYAYALDRARAITGREPGAAERAAILDRLIEEELLVQRAIELGVLQSDREVRKTVARAMLERVVESAGRYRAGSREVARYYAAHAARFAVPERTVVTVAAFRDRDRAGDALDRALEVKGTIAAGVPFEVAIRALADPPTIPVPSIALTERALAMYVGPVVARAVGKVAVGEVGGPFASPAGHMLITVRDREPSRTPALDDVEEQIRAELAREAADRTARQFFFERRRRTQVVLASNAPQEAR
jgi:hypothetical protein